MKLSVNYKWGQYEEDRVRMMKKSTIAGASLILLTALTLTACAGKQDAKSTAKDSKTIAVETLAK